MLIIAGSISLPSLKPHALVIAGPNGSGKSTITKALDIAGTYINADDIKRVKKCSDLEAAQEAETIREACLKAKADFSFETVLSTERNLALMERMVAADYSITGAFVLTKDPLLNVARVRSRVLAGGHAVPEDKTIDRYWRSLANIPKFVSLCDTCYLFDNTAQPQIIYTNVYGKTTITKTALWSYEAITELVAG
jgi:predicted ABC-type ATPase